MEQMLIILYPQFLAQGAKNLAYGTPLSPPMSMADMTNYPWLSFPLSLGRNSECCSTPCNQRLGLAHEMKPNCQSDLT